MGSCSVRSTLEDSLGKLLFPRDKVGKKVFRVQHFPKGSPRPDESPMAKSLPHAWKISKIRDVKRLILDNKKIKSAELRIRSGECRDTDTVERALESGMTVLMQCGNKMANRRIRDKYLELLSRYGDRFKIYKLDKRPLIHGMMFVLPNTQHLLLEDPHKHNEFYKSALIVEDATDDFSNEYFNNDFEYWLSRLKPLDEKSLRSMELYDECEHADSEKIRSPRASS